MGINMEIKMVIGVKYDTLPDTMMDEDKEFICSDSEIQHYPDCYSGEWDIVGYELNSSQDNRYEQQDFIWSVQHLTSITEIVNAKFKRAGIKADPYLIVFTYYT
jgi:hypothetical protein